MGSDGRRRAASVAVGMALAVTGIIAFMGIGAAEDAGALPAEEIVRRADRQRGLDGAHAFLARIVPEREGDGTASDSVGATRGMLVEVRSNGFEQQLVFVIEPNRGDVMLATPEVVWLRPRRLHRLTRVPPDLRMFNGASVSDVTSIDVLGSYTATLDPTASIEPDELRLALVATKERMRYPRASYVVRRSDFRPLRIDFMTANGKVLKTLVYESFAAVLGRTVPTRLLVRDHVRNDGTVVVLSEFRHLSEVDPSMFLPDYLLSLPDVAS